MKTKIKNDPDILKYHLLKQLFKLQYPSRIKRYQKRLLPLKLYERSFIHQNRN